MPGHQRISDHEWVPCDFFQQPSYEVAQTRHPLTETSFQIPIMTLLKSIYVYNSQITHLWACWTQIPTIQI